MAHGQPDYGMYTLARTIYRMTDMGELAARLGSIDLFDRRGDIICLDTFKYGITNWSVTGTAVQDNTESLSDGYSAKLSLAAAVGNTSGIRRYLATPVSSRIGIEYSYLPTNVDPILGLVVLWLTGTYQHQAAIYYDQRNDVVKYRDSDGNYTTLTSTLRLYYNGATWHTLKLALDFSSVYYTRLLLDQHSIDMSDLAIQSLANAGDPYLYVYIYAENVQASANDIYIDNFIATQNEPA